MHTPAELEARFPRLLEHAHGDAAEVLLRHLDVVRLDTGDLLLDPSRRSRSLYLVWQGQLGVTVRTAAGRHLNLGEVGAGNWVGDVTFLDGGFPTAEVKAMEPTEILALDHDALERLRESEPELVRAILHGVCLDLSHRLRVTSHLMWTLAGGKAGEDATTMFADGGLARAWRRLVGSI